MHATPSSVEHATAVPEHVVQSHPALVHGSAALCELHASGVPLQEPADHEQPSIALHVGALIASSHGDGVPLHSFCAEQPSARTH